MAYITGSLSSGNFGPSFGVAAINTSSHSPLTISTHATPQMSLFPETSPQVITINGKNGKQLVQIQKDGTVVVSQYGSNFEAANRFYEVLQVFGQTLRSKVTKLEAEVMALKANVTHLESQNKYAVVAMKEIRNALTDDDDHPTAQKIKTVADLAIRDLS